MLTIHELEAQKHRDKASQFLHLMFLAASLEAQKIIQVSRRTQTPGLVAAPRLAAPTRRSLDALRLQ
jgi:hypothetical protein